MSGCLKKYPCTRIDADFTPDADWDKPVWSGAKEIELTQNADGAPARQPTSAKLCYSDKFLYVIWKNVDCHIVATMTEFNDLIYDEEVCEIFIDDDNDLETYQEFEISPINTTLHYLIQNDLRGKNYSFARVGEVTKSAVLRTADGWVAEMAIPLDEFRNARNRPPKPGDSWRINLFRIDRDNDGRDEFLTWCPNFARSFHGDPRVFGWLEFGK